MYHTTKKYHLTAAFFLISFLGFGQFATLCVVNPDGLDVNVEVNEINYESKSSDFCINRIPFEIFALKMKTPLGEQKKLVFGRLDDTSFVSISPKGFRTAWSFSNKTLLAYNFGLEEDQLASAQFFTDSAKTELALAEASNNSQATAPKLDVKTDDLKNPTKKPSGIVISKPETTNKEENGCNNFLTENELKGIKNLLKKTKSLDLQLNIAQSSLKDKCFNCNQLQEIFKLIEEDDLKVNLFKRLYPQLTDPQKRKTLYSEFLFDSSIDEIKAYGL
ncbi:DUF4476 domain-containing protein [Luteibaculum oceani]|uniref:DUF4476 domain-containing protein n=1 Tax=Luteibaculum oceani TaxID=1294296 RepID=A0A5C6VAS5_9FLAO|nr:DUF4476 domain-containing protein [Luteibaculum oceani]TXC81466.1 DUF4476 domain-containing protein [Luteibaculum oceani]